MVLIQLVILCFTGKIVFGHSNGAPSKSCFHMLPGHTRSGSIPVIFPTDLSRSLYKVEAKIDGKYVRLSITGRSGQTTVAGFLIQARQTENGPAVGMFTQSNDFTVQYQDCTGDKHKYPKFSSITHTSPAAKTNLTFLWSPIVWNQNISVKFYATLVYNYGIFWHKQPSNEISILDMSSNDTPGRHIKPSLTLSTMAVYFIMNLFIH